MNCPSKEKLWENFKAILVRLLVHRNFNRLTNRQRLFFLEAVVAESDSGEESASEVESEEESLEEPRVAKCNKYHRYICVKEAHG